MGVNWNAVRRRWAPHRSREGTVYSLYHLNPRSVEIELPAYKGDPALRVVVRIGYSMHTFTCDLALAGPNPEIYADEREQRAFDVDRHKLSQRLPQIIRELYENKRKCFFASPRDNYITVHLEDMPAGFEYRVFFDLRKGEHPNEVILIVQSAYLAELKKLTPGRLRRKPVRFRVLLKHALQGSKPSPSVR